MPMFSKMFNQVGLMSQGLDTAWLRHEVSSNNISNIDTPGYKARHVLFETEMRNALSGKGSMEGVTTHRNHFKIGGVPNPANVRPVTITANHHTARMDGNNVNIDSEMANLAENYIRYSALTSQVNSEFIKLRMVIREQA